MTWQRHQGDAKFHAGAPDDGGSWKTLCDGRWSLTDVDAGEVERHVNPRLVECCALCVQRAASAAARSSAHGYMAVLEREVIQLRHELEERTNDLHVVERELAQQHEFERALAPIGVVTALIEALSIAQSAGRRGLLSAREHQRLRELAKVVPQ